MRILFLTHRLPYAPNRGDRIRAYHLLRYMSRFADVSLFSLVHDDDEARHVDHVPFASDVACVRVPRLRNVVHGLARLGTDIPLTHSLLDAPDASASLARLVRRTPPDVILAYCSGMARFAMQPPLDRTPCILDMVDVDSVKWAEYATRATGPRRWIFRREAITLRRFEADAVRHARTTLVINEREHQALTALVPASTISVMQVGVDLEAFAPPAPPVAAPVVVFCGVMNYQANEEGVCWFAKNAWPRVRAVRPDARFIIVGSSPTRVIRQLAARDSSIDVVGSVPAVQPYLWQSAVSVAPLQMARGLQTKVLESLAAGLPTVVTPAVWNGLPEEVMAGCIVAGTPEEFAAAILRLLDMDPNARRRRAFAANLERLTWTERLRGLEGILRAATAPMQAIA